MRISCEYYLVHPECRARASQIANIMSFAHIMGNDKAFTCPSSLLVGIYFDYSVFIVGSFTATIMIATIDIIHRDREKVLSEYPSAVSDREVFFVNPYNKSLIVSIGVYDSLSKRSFYMMILLLSQMSHHKNVALRSITQER